MKTMVIGDIHVADKPPSVRTETYAEDILAKVAWCSVEAYTRGCDFILQLGDIFHIKSPYRNSHGLVQATHEALTRGGLEVVCVAGNHDMMHDRLDSIPSQPLGSLSRMEGVTLLEGWHEKFPVYGIPYLADWSTVRDWLDPFAMVGGTAHLPTGTIPLVATHAPIFPPGQEPIYDSIDPADWAEMQYRLSACAYGHIHDPHGAYKVGNVTFANFGAISRGSLHSETLKRKPQVAVYDFTTGEFEAVPVPHKPVEEVFRMDLHEATVSKKHHMASFLEGLGSDTLELTTIEKVLHDLDGMGLAPATSTVARELVEEAYAQQPE